VNDWNGGFPDVRDAITARNAKVIREWAKVQEKAGASYIDVNMELLRQNRRI